MLSGWRKLDHIGGTRVGDRLANRTGWLISSGAFFAPVIVVLALSSFGFADPATPDIVEVIKPSEKSIDVFVTLAQVMITMSVGCAVASQWLFRQPLKRRYLRVQAVILCVSMAAALITLYSGLRFLYEIGAQLSLMSFEFSLVKSRLYLEGIGLLSQVSILSFNAVVHHYYRDERYSDRG